MMIETVKNLSNSYLVNGSIFIPKDPSNRDYQEIQKWIDNGGILEPEFSVDEARTKRISELDYYHFNSPELRVLTINSYFKFALNQEGRNLIAEQICNLIQQIKLETLAEEDASFEYFYNGSSIEVSLTQLRQIYVEMLRIVNTNFATYKQHTYNIKNNVFADAAAVEAYDFTENYLKNNNINLS